MNTRPVAISQLRSRGLRRREPIIAHLVTEPSIGRPLWALVANDNDRELRTSAIEHIVFDVDSGVMFVETAHSTYAIGALADEADDAG